MKNKLIKIQDKHTVTVNGETYIPVQRKGIIADEILELFDYHVTDGSPCWCNPTIEQQKNHLSIGNLIQRTGDEPV